MKKLFLIFLALCTLSKAYAQSIAYADEVVGFSSQYVILAGWDSGQILGAPNVYPAYGDLQGSWASESKDDMREYIELKYNVPSQINEIWVFETFKPGAIDTVYVKNLSGQWEIVWSGSAAPLADESRIFKASFPKTTFQVSEIRLAINSPEVDNYNEIDAVAIVDTDVNPRPDLTIENVVINSDPIKTSAKLNISTTILNDGFANAESSVIGFYLVTPDEAEERLLSEAGGQLIAEVSLEDLAEAESRMIDVEVDISTVEVGGYELLVVADHTSAIDESLEINNSFTTETFTVLAGQTQTILFVDALSGIIYGDESINLTAIATSDLEVAYTTIGPIEVNENTLIITGAGEASVTAIQSGNDDYFPADPVTIDFTIDKKLLTATAEDVTLSFGDPLPEMFPISYSGFVEGDDETILDISPQPSFENDPVAVGSYVISLNGGNDTDYEFFYANGILTINKADQTIDFEQIISAGYGDVIDLSVTASSDLLVDIDVVSGPATLNGNSLTITGTGAIEIKATQEGDDSYNPAPVVTVNLEASKASLTATADDFTITEGDVIPVLTISYDGFKLNDDASVIDVLPTISTTATTSSVAGDYDIILDGGTDDLYDLTLVNGSLTIEALPLSVNDEMLTVYPNPVVDRLLVKGVEVATMWLLSIEGKELQLLENKEEMDVSRLKSGKYILRLQDKSGNLSTHRIIKR